VEIKIAPEEEIAPIYSPINDRHGVEMRVDGTGDEVQCPDDQRNGVHCSSLKTYKLASL
jgi:hypothetical protein